jgi:uncharacterized damage-inducible protein DinB
MTEPHPPYANDEREMLIAFLDVQRKAAASKLDGLSEEQGRHPPTPPGNSIMSLIQHLAWVEVWWFQMNFAGESPTNPWSDGDMDADFRIAPDSMIPGLLNFYRRTCERNNEIVRAAPSLDDQAKYTKRTDGVPTLRWILNHMITETARHAGHADIARDVIEGPTWP